MRCFHKKNCYYYRDNVLGGGFNHTNSNNSTSDVKDLNTENMSSCGTEIGNLLEKSDDSTSIKSSANDGLADNATPDDVLSLIDY